MTITKENGRFLLDGRIFNPRAYEVFLDGTDVTSGTVAACESEGWVDSLVAVRRTERGATVWRMEENPATGGKRPVIERSYGSVEIRKKTGDALFVANAVAMGPYSSG